MHLMTKFLNQAMSYAVVWQNFKNDRDGVTAVEYAIVFSCIVVIVSAFFNDGGVITNMLYTLFDRVQNSVTTTVQNA